MEDLGEGESVEMKGSSATPYVLRNDRGVYSCSCPAWRHQPHPIDRRTCKHLKTLRGEQIELDRVGIPSPRAPSAASGSSKSSSGSSGATGAPVLLAEKWDPSFDPTGWWASEKLDGVRAYWDGTQFLSRLGNRFIAPDWFVEGLPDHPLDGELWAGRKRFQDTVSIVRRADGGSLWRSLSFLVFDAPAHGGRFEDRLTAVDGLCTEERTPFARPLFHEQCKGFDHLKTYLSSIEAQGGEGVMLRKAGSAYQVGRSSTLLKVKTFHDAEALVLDHVPGTGKHKGRLGSLLASLADGTRFNVGTGFSDAERSNPPAIGTVITFRYQELTNRGVPRFPSYVGVRIDGLPGPLPIGALPVSAAPAPGSAPRAAPRATPASVAPSVVWSPPVHPVQSTGAPMAKSRRFEFEEGSSSKFWEVRQDGASFTVTYGKIGSSGTQKTKKVDDDAGAANEIAKLVKEKVGKGYVELDAGEFAPAPAPKLPPPRAAAAASAAVAVSRRFEFVEGSSSKFWEVSQQGEAFTVTYGRIGSKGAEKTKVTGSEAAATAEVAKLVAEKVGKGYAEVGGTPTPPAPAKPAAAPTPPTAPVAKAKAANADNGAEMVKAFAAEARPLVASLRAQAKRSFPDGLPKDTLTALDIDEDEIELLEGFLADATEALAILARLG